MTERPAPLAPVLPGTLFQNVPVATRLGGGLLKFAHHPHCDRHIHHLIWMKGHPFCLGCTSVAAGIPFGLAIAALIPWSVVPLPAWILGHALLITPTALQPLIQKKRFKIAARALLGAATASYLLTGLFLKSYFSNPWIWRGCILLAFATGFIALYKWRQKKPNNPCDTCQLGQFPTCEWNMPRLLAENTNDPVWIKIAEDFSNR